MKLDLHINEANDYARDICVPVLHPHVAIIHYDEAGEIRHSLNHIDCYGIFLQREFPEGLTYGIGTYHDGDGSLMANIRTELANAENGDDVQDDIIRDYIQLILDYCNRFYARQFKEMTAGGSDILSRFKQVLTDYYANNMQKKNGLPSVKYCASELCLSPGYFGDVVRGALGESPKDYIRGFIVRRAKNLLLGGQSIAQVSDALGFEYPNHFTRLFKQLTGQTPSQFLTKQRQK